MGAVSDAPTQRYARRLALTGIAEVLLARYRFAADDERLVVVKRLLPHVRSDEEFVEALVREARRVESFAHDGIVRIIDVTDDAECRVVTDYVSGEPIEALFEREKGRAPVPVGVACRVVADAAAIVHAGHDASLLHRDLRPSKVFVTYDGRVRIADYGVAGANPNHAYTQPGTLRVRYGYVPPEYLTDELYDERSDVFSLGVLLWELLTGRRLHEGRSPADVVRAVLHGELLPPSHVDASVPPELDDVVMAALARDPQQRPASALAFAEAIDGVLARLHLKVGPEQVGSWMRLVFASELASRRRYEQEVLHGEERPDALVAPELPGAPSRPIAPSATPAFFASNPEPIAPLAPPRWRRPLLVTMLFVFLAIAAVAVTQILEPM